METAQAAVRGDIVYGKLKPGKTLAPHALKIDTKRGSQKNILAYYPTTECRRLVAYCIGDKTLLDEALNEWGHISHIGAKRRMGHGLIQSISIEDDDTALTAWQKRTMPWPLCDDVVPMRCTTQNPYFDKTKVKDGCFLTVKVVYSKHYPSATSPVFGANQANRLIPTAHAS